MKTKNTVYEVFPWTIQDEWYLMSSIKTEFDGLCKTKASFWLNFKLKNEGWTLRLSQHVRSDSDVGFAFLSGFYTKLYQNDVIFEKSPDWKPADLKRKYSVALRHNHCFQIKKPGELWLNTFGSSSWMVENILNESAQFLPVGKSLEIRLQVIPDKLDSITKEFLYAWKCLWKSIEYAESLESSFNERLWFFLFDFGIAHDFDSPDRFDAILDKNLSLRDSDWNSYVWKKSKFGKPKFPNRKKKGQADMFIWQWLVSLIQRKNPIVSSRYPKHVPIPQSQAENWWLGHSGKWTEPYVGFGFRGWKLDEKEPASIKMENLKNGHGIILWGTWSWKSYTSSLALWCDVLRTSEQDEKNHSKSKPWSRFIIADPHWSMRDNLKSVVGHGIGKKSNISIYEYGHAQDSNCVELSMNPLYVRNLGSGSGFHSRLNKSVEACLDWIRWIHTFASFWAQNSSILSLVIGTFILFNDERQRQWKAGAGSPYLKTYTLGDVSEFLKEISMSWGKIGNWALQDIKVCRMSKNQELASAMDRYSTALNRIATLAKGNSASLSSSINKVEIFEKGLSRTFGKGIPAQWNSLDLPDLMSWNKNPQTEVHYFNLGWWTADEKSVISSFILAYSFHYWTWIDHSSENWVPRTSVRVDEAASVLESDYTIELVWNALAQMRKYWYDFKFLMQSVGQKAFATIYPNIWILQVFSVSADQFKIIWPDMNAWTPFGQITESDIVNCSRWWSYCLCKFSNWANSLALIRGFWKNDVQKILSN